MLPLPISPEQLSTALGWVFDKVAGQVSPSEGPAALLSEAQIDRQVALHTAMAGGTGFVSNLGGLMTLPFALPANLLGVATIQLKLIATVAAGRGYSLESEEVKRMSLACLTGSAALEVVKEGGIRAGMRLGQRLLGQRLVGQGAAGFGRAVPLLGGVIGGGFDAASTRAVGAIARRVFPRIGTEPGAVPEPVSMPVPALPAPPSEPIA